MIVGSPVGALRAVWVERRLSESSLQPDAHERIRVRVDAYLGSGMDKSEAWRRVREENDALLARGAGL